MLLIKFIQNFCEQIGIPVEKLERMYIKDGPVLYLETRQKDAVTFPLHVQKDGTVYIIPGEADTNTTGETRRTWWKALNELSKNGCETPDLSRHIIVKPGVFYADLRDILRYMAVRKAEQFTDQLKQHKDCGIQAVSDAYRLYTAVNNMPKNRIW